MAKTIPVSFDGVLSYQIEIRNDFSDLITCLLSSGCKKDSKICIVSDSNVAKTYSNQLYELLKNTFSAIGLFVFEAGEARKNTDTVEKLYEQLINDGFDRHDYLVALGGGVVGDLTGFAAATYLRGIEFIQIPTSLLAQVDSSIGGKTGVDFKQYKNMVGAFHQPKLVYMNLSTLQSLPKRQLSSGVAEILKHGLIKDNAYFEWMNEHQEKIYALDLDTLEEMIYRSCNIKCQVVENDPTEKGERALLNFGHTLGHAVEKLSDFQLFHGECVSIGAIAASYLSMKKGNLSAASLSYIEDTFQKFELPLTVSGQSADEILKTSKSDKKMKAGKINFILLKDLGSAYIYPDFTDEEILDGIHYIITESPAQSSAKSLREEE